MNHAFCGLLLTLLMPSAIWAEKVLIENRTTQPFVHQFYRAHDGTWSENMTLPSGERQEYSTPVPLVVRFLEGSDWTLFTLIPGQSLCYQADAKGANRLTQVGATQETASAARPAADGDVASLKALLRHRYLAAKRRLQATEAAYDTATTSLEWVFWARGQCLTAAWDLCETSAQRLAILQEQVALARQRYAKVYALYQLGAKGGEAEQESQARLELLNAEVQLLRQQIAAKSEGGAPSVLVPNCDPSERAAIAAFEALGGRAELDSDQPGAHVVAISFPYAAAAHFDLGIGLGQELLPWESPPATPRAPLPPVAPPAPPRVLPRTEQPSAPARDPIAKPAPATKTMDEELMSVREQLSIGDPSPILTNCTPHLPESTVQQIGTLRSLRRADLSTIRLSNADLRHLKGLQQLQELKIAGEFTDAGLEHLSGLTSLRSLDIAGGRLTAKGIEQLTKALPQATIRGDAPAATAPAPRSPAPAPPAPAADKAHTELKPR